MANKLALWKLIYHTRNRRARIGTNPMQFTFFYAEDEKDARKQVEVWKTRQKWDIVEEGLSACPFGFKLNHSSLPAELPSKQ